MPALKKTRVWPSLNFSLSSLTMSITADGDSGEHTVALVLVHHQAGLNASGDLVGV